MPISSCIFCCFSTQSYLKDQWEAWRNIPWNNVWRTSPQQCHTCLRRASAYNSYHCNAGLEPTQSIYRLKNSDMLYTLQETWGFFHNSVTANPSALGCDNVLCCVALRLPIFRKTECLHIQVIQTFETSRHTQHHCAFTQILLLSLWLMLSGMNCWQNLPARYGFDMNLHSRWQHQQGGIPAVCLTVEMQTNQQCMQPVLKLRYSARKASA